MPETKTPEIPPMTDPLGKYWEQPALENISLTLSHAWMNQQDFDLLKHYQHTQPTGTYIGKMWKKKIRGRWHLVWWSQDPDPGYLKNNYLRIGII